MKTIISPFSSTTVFAAAMVTMVNFHSSPPNSSQLFHSFTGGIKFANLLCKAAYKPSNEEVSQKVGLPLWQPAIVEDDVDKEDSISVPNSQEKTFLLNNDINDYVEAIKTILGSMEDGKITPSAYDTAWVALIQDVSGPSRGPRFPACLQWVANNQLSDGSWGEPLIFLAYERLLNTLACVVALTFWNVHPDKCQKGMKFMKENIKKLEDENEDHMTIGFEIVFPPLIEIARKLNIKVPTDSPILKEINTRRNLKLTKIPKEKMYKEPTSILFSLEGMQDFGWEKLIKLQSKDGSMLASPSATAFAFIKTKDENSLKYLTNVVAKFIGGVPNVYPVDMFEHMWVVDRLERLGISRYFRPQIKECVDYIYRHWNEKGAGYSRHLNVKDTDDTAMGFRVLRMNGYQVSSDVFRLFEKDGQFVCFSGQTSQSVTAMFNLLRASKMLFPGEKILEEANKFSYKFLTNRRLSNKLFDKWVIAKDLPGEVGFALDVPWYASLPRLEARYYLEQYGGDDDVWIGKVLYRMGNVNNNIYLEMAKLDYNSCQAIHRREWNHMQKWYAGLKIEGFEERLLSSYYEAAACIFEPERCNERINWAKTLVLLETITSFFAKSHFSNDHRRAFVDEFRNILTPFRQESQENEQTWTGVMGALHETLNWISSEALAAYGVDVHPHLCCAWETWLRSWEKGVDVAQGKAELIVRTITLSSGVSQQLLSHPQYGQLSSVINNICHQISHKENCVICLESGTLGNEIESKMQELVQLVLRDSPDDLDTDLKQTFLMVAKTFYYRAYFDPETINIHIFKVLFENVI